MLISILLLSCDEPFPQYTEPENVLSGEISVTGPDTVLVYNIMGVYFINTPLIMNVNVTNRHDDLLQGDALVDGLVIVQSFSEIPRVLLVPLTTGNLLTPPVFQGNIALGPGASAQFSTLWIPFAVDGSIVYGGTSFVQTPTGRIYGPIDFIPSVEVQLFERVQPIKFEGQAFSLIFREVDG
jgi:hypothetical protein